METYHKAIIIFLFAIVTGPALSADPLGQAFSAVARGQQELIKGQSAQAEKAFTDALDLFPGWYRPMLGMAVVQLQMGRPVTKAIKWINKALSLEPNRWDTQLTAGRVMEAAGRPEQAMQHYLRAAYLSAAHRDVIRDYACSLAARIPKTKKTPGFQNLRCNKPQPQN